MVVKGTPFYPVSHAHPGYLRPRAGRMNKDVMSNYVDLITPPASPRRVEPSRVEPRRVEPRRVEPIVIEDDEPPARALVRQESCMIVEPMAPRAAARVSALVRQESCVIVEPPVAIARPWKPSVPVPGMRLAPSPPVVVAVPCPPEPPRPPIQSGVSSGAGGQGSRLDIIDEESKLDLTDKQLMILWKEFSKRTYEGQQCHSENTLSRLVERPVQFVIDFMASLRHSLDQQYDDDPEDDSMYEETMLEKLSEAYSSAREEYCSRTYKEVAERENIPEHTLREYSMSRKQTYLSNFQEVMMRNQGANPIPISEFLPKLNAIPFGGKFAPFNYFTWMEQNDIQEEEEQGAGQGAGGAARKRKPKAKKDDPLGNEDGAVKPKRKAAIPFSPAQLARMEREYTKRRGQKLSKAETAALNIEVLKDLNHVDMAGRPIDNQAFNSWMSRKRHEDGCRQC